MTYSNKVIATLFSNGQFDLVTDSLSEAVMEYCKGITEYFNSLETDFNTDKVIALDNTVIVTGTAALKQNGQHVAFISACDIYNFNQNNQIEKISSYCIPEKPNRN